MDPLTRQVLSCAGGKKDSTYVDDVFSTYVYKGTSGSLSINNGIDVSGEGGLVWVKDRTSSSNHKLFDTARGVNKEIESNSSDAENTDSNYNQNFTSTGFTFNTNYTTVNTNTDKYVSWTFRKAPGFFDIVTYTGNNTAGTQIAHNLGCVPAMILVKKTSSIDSWYVYSSSLDDDDPANYAENFNMDGQRNLSPTVWNNTAPTSTHFTLGSASGVNGGSSEFVAYLFAGGESTADTARSVEFDGTDDDLNVPTSTDFDFGNGDFTVECWINTTQTSAAGVVNISNGSAASNSAWLLYLSGGVIKFYWTVGTGWSGPVGGVTKVNNGQWHHVAVTRTGGIFYLYIDGTLDMTYNIGSTSIPASTRTLEIGCQAGNLFFDGRVSNVRIVKGTAVYTSTFKPVYEPLTNITNTKLLCCNNSSITGATVTTGTITANGAPQPSTYSPFDDPEGYKFGEEGDKNVIKCGSYVGNGSSDGPEIDLGWEPQWIMIKRFSDSGGHWCIWDSMRGILTDDGDDNRLKANETSSENEKEYFDPTPTGFKIRTTDSNINKSNSTHLYVCIRRPDGYVGKPAEVGTDSFSTSAGLGQAEPFSFTSGFPVDLFIHRQPASTQNWFTTVRMIGDKYVLTNSSDNQATTNGGITYDSNTQVGFGYDSAWQSWCWKRGQGIDVVGYTGTFQGRQVPHNLGRTPEMIWVKRLSAGTVRNWVVYHKDLNGGTNPEKYHLILNNTDGQVEQLDIWQDTAPSSTDFTLGGSPMTNSGTIDYISMLFASVEGISKCGTFAGTSTSVTVNLGFQPRYLIIKKINGSGYGWFTWDSVRGMGTDPSPKLALNDSAAQDSGYQYFTVSSTGFEIFSSMGWGDHTGNEYVYYAHA